MRIEDAVQTIATDWTQNSDLSMGEAYEMVFNEMLTALAGREASPDLLRDIALNDFGVDLETKGAEQ